MDVSVPSLTAVVVTKTGADGPVEGTLEPHDLRVLVHRAKRLRVLFQASGLSRLAFQADRSGGPSCVKPQGLAHGAK